MKFVSIDNDTQKWHSDSAGTIVGLHTGADFCAEHEGGIGPLMEALLPDNRPRGLFRKKRPYSGIDRFRVDKVKASNHLRLIESQSKKGYEMALIGSSKPIGEYAPEALEHFLSSARASLNAAPRSFPITAGWDGNNFVILVRDTSKSNYVIALKLLYSAALNGNLYLGGFTRNEFPGVGGIGLLNAELLDPAVIDQAHQRLVKAEREDAMIKELSKKEGFDNLCKELKKAGYDWFSLRPCVLSQYDGEGVYYWLNPTNRSHNNCGYFTIDELRQWLNGHGPVPKSTSNDKVS